MNISNFMVQKGIYVFAITVAIIAAFFYYKKRNKKLREKVNRLSFRLPVLGGVLRCGANARFARTMSTLFDAGVPLMRALNATAPATGSPMYEEAVYNIRDDVQNGQQISFAMKNTGLFGYFFLRR